MSKQTKAKQANQRDGSIDVVHIGRQAHWTRDFYHLAVSASWPRFISDVLLIYLAINAVFAFGYYLCGQSAFDGATAPDGWRRWLECFFFSVQTLGTIGYGKISPAAFSSNILVTVEALVGLLSLAVVTGLMFSRFSRPSARVIFSDVALISSHDGVPSLLFRIANERKSQIVDASLQVHLLRNEQTAEGETYYAFNDLKLERSHSPFFTASWTVVHPIDQHSPLFGQSKEDLVRVEAQIIVSFSGIIETFSQPVHARHSYNPDQMAWDHRFVDMLDWEDDTLIVHLERIHEIEPMQRRTL